MIIGITGTLGAGKGTVVDYLVKRKGFTHYSVRQFLTEEIGRRGMPVNRDSMNMIGEELRAKHGGGYILETLYERARIVGEDAIIESIRAVGEVEAMRKKGMLLIAVDADPKIRYDRVAKRGSETDAVSYEKFLADEERENKGDDPARMNLRQCINLAGFKLTNNGSLEELHAQIEEVLAKIAA